MKVKRLRLVTSQQLSEGYYQLRGHVAFQRSYRVMHDRGDGTFIVEYEEEVDDDPRRCPNRAMQSGVKQL